MCARLLVSATPSGAGAASSVDLWSMRVYCHEGKTGIVAGTVGEIGENVSRHAGSGMFSGALTYSEG